jgi:teichuronic acid biosynthesis glycosyltransferase TuaH
VTGRFYDESVRSGSHRTVKEASEELRGLVVCSLKAWDNVWNRNNFLADALLRRNPDLRVLFVEPPVDPIYDVARGRPPGLPRFVSVIPGRLRALRPLKALPRKFGGLSDQLLRRQVQLATRAWGLERPVLWINDVTYAPLAASTGWPSLYDVSDDWLLAPFGAREIARLRRLDELALQIADEVVVCSEALEQSRGRHRHVHLIPNAVDVEHFRRPQARPADLPEAPVALYAGTAHDARIDVSLLTRTGAALPFVQFVLVGPNALSRESRRALGAVPNVRLLGPRAYSDLPGYLQHADVLIVPHLLSPFTESLDPIKAYEFLAVGTPTVATPVPGFRDHPDAFELAVGDGFGACIRALLERGSRPTHGLEPPTWDARAAAFEVVLMQAAGQTGKPRSPLAGDRGPRGQ